MKQRKYFLNITRKVKYLARQGLPLQGNGEDGNFKQLVTLLSSQSEFDTMVTLAKYNHHDYQNKIMEINGNF